MSKSVEKSLNKQPLFSEDELNAQCAAGVLPKYRVAEGNTPFDMVEPIYTEAQYDDFKLRHRIDKDSCQQILNEYKGIRLPVVYDTSANIHNVGAVFSVDVESIVGWSVITAVTDDSFSCSVTFNERGLNIVPDGTPHPRLRPYCAATVAEVDEDDGIIYYDVSKIISMRFCI